jgi:hypothetical protein
LNFISQAGYQVQSEAEETWAWCLIHIISQNFN